MRFITKAIGEEIRVGDAITVRVGQIEGHNVWLDVYAPIWLEVAGLPHRSEKVCVKVANGGQFGIGSAIRVRAEEVRANHVRLGIAAPQDQCIAAYQRPARWVPGSLYQRKGGPF